MNADDNILPAFHRLVQQTLNTLHASLFFCGSCAHIVFFETVVPADSGLSVALHNWALTLLIILFTGLCEILWEAPGRGPFMVK